LETEASHQLVKHAHHIIVSVIHLRKGQDQYRLFY